MLHTIKSILLVCLGALLLNACAQTPVKTYPYSDIEIKYAVRHFEADVTQSVEKFKGDYLTREQIESISKEHFIQLLKDNNLLAEEGDINVVDLDIFIDYTRRFVGDGTPFPVEKMTAPTVDLHEASYLGDTVIRKNISRNLLLDDLFNGLLTETEELERTTAQAVANKLLENLQNRNQYDRNAFAAMTAGMTDNEKKQKRQYSETPLPQDPSSYGLDSENYLPEALVQRYLQRLANGSRDERIDLYKELIGEWNNSSALYEQINATVLTGYESTDSDVIEEVIWASKALAYSGLARYRSTLNTIMNSNAPDKLKGYVEDYLETMTVRTEQAKTVHDVSTMSPDLDWQTNQLRNMLNSSDNQLRVSAVKTIYRNQLYSDPLLDEISHILRSEAVLPRKRYAAFSDFYAWNCRVLGSSGKTKYKALLTDLAENAYSHKVREYAEEFADEL
ncbi:hypothetical protein [Idiomarina xiamenensis]|uniref:Lipoprotein n=1 Tax=Idiomarina xiamenensis 10-D-4 TaxID=740709 RepID=K2KAF2_9GAMM|nr:hypothetical protein [Idiomarina xiamenensis]EKE79909.1 hypothetical protein A10D4_12418 [Idiomarina xiamenensis 10-D-4]